MAGTTVRAIGDSVALRVAAARLEELGADLTRHRGTPPAHAPAGWLGLEHTPWAPGAAPRFGCGIDWAGPVTLPMRDEGDVQAACGLAHLHGRARGGSHALRIDYASVCAGVLASQAVLGAALAAARGGAAPPVSVSVAQAALLAAAPYVAAEGVSGRPPHPRRGSVPGASAAPPFRSADGTPLEIETLDAEAWSRFWAVLGAPVRAVSAGWPPFQSRFGTAVCPLPAELAERFAAADPERLRSAADRSGVGLVPLRAAQRADAAHSEARWRARVVEGTGLRSAGLPPLPAGAAIPLLGLRVVEATTRIQGPLAGQLLRMLGADVVRIEPPGGDPMRGVPPMAGACSARFLALNHGKGAVEADLKTERGRRAARELAATSDVLLYNWPPGRAEAFGLGPDDLALPGLVHVHVDGWDGDPPGRAVPATDYLVQAHGGVADLLAGPGEEPAPSLLTLTDTLGGIIAAERAVAGLLARVRAGSGVRVRTALADAAHTLRRAGRESAPRRQEDGPRRVWDPASVAAAPEFARAFDRVDTAACVRSPWSPGRPAWTSSTGLVLTDLVPGQLRARWSARGWCPDRDLYSLFRDRVRAHPGREAVIDDRGPLTYAELDERVRRMASLLAADGLGERDVVALLLPEGRESAVADLAVAAIGAVVLPVPYGRTPADVHGLLRRSRARALLTTGDRSGQVRRRELPHVERVRTLGPQDPDGPGPAEAGEWRPARTHPESPARILVSSGSEGEPSMVAYTHNAMAGGRGNYVGALHTGPGPMRVLLLVSTASSFGSLGVPVTLARHGGTLIVLERFDPAAALAAVQAHRPTHLIGVPTMLRRIAVFPGEADTSSLRTVVASGAPLDREVRDACARRFGGQVVNVYGSTDGVNCHTASRPQAWEPGMAGYPAPDVAEISVRDPDGRPVPAGATGEIWALGPMTPMCYVAAPGLDAERRAPGGWVRTGDLGRLDPGGALHVVDRLRRMVIRGGVNLFPAEVERALGAHPGLAEAHCVPVPDPDLGERMCACVSPAPGSAVPTARELLAFLREEHGLDRRALPEHVLVLPELPLGPTGKVCTITLTRLAAESVHR
ncbi:AMP-binding protein [Nocardiopsis sp. CNT312]|uniref:AMP-binding protein n=1 Tax=Nocardiopsis sp. CNT312 TaxID=1137268 RepID=UPI003510C060